jgi:hypothetical protein
VAFILSLKEMVPFPLDEFPKASEVGVLLTPFGCKTRPLFAKIAMAIWFPP